MKHIAAYLLLTIGGNAEPTAEDVKKVLASVGAEANEDQLKSLIAQVHGKDINALIGEGLSKLASVPSGGSASAAAAPSSGGAAAAAEAPKEEKKEEKEESDEDMGFGLFD